MTGNGLYALDFRPPSAAPRHGQISASQDDRAVPIPANGDRGTDRAILQPGSALLLHHTTCATRQLDNVLVERTQQHGLAHPARQRHAWRPRRKRDLRPCTLASAAIPAPVQGRRVAAMPCSGLRKRFLCRRALPSRCSRRRCGSGEIAWPRRRVIGVPAGKRSPVNRLDRPRQRRARAAPARGSSSSRAQAGRPISIADVARSAGVSTATASRVMNPHGDAFGSAVGRLLDRIWAGDQAAASEPVILPHEMVLAPHAAAGDSDSLASRSTSTLRNRFRRAPGWQDPGRRGREWDTWAPLSRG